VSHEHGHDDDPAERWLALTCEVEREAPDLLERLGASASTAEAARLGAIVRAADEPAFLAWLAEARARLETLDGLDADAARLAAVLREVYLLLPGLRAPSAEELDELRRLRALAA
jgi:hypothetical protein